jgi:hypothetical protein
VREPRAWYASAWALYQLMDTVNNRQPYRFFLRLVGLSPPLDYTRTFMDLPIGINGRMYRALRAGEEEAVSFYNHHVAEVIRDKHVTSTTNMTDQVRATVPPGRLLVYSVRDGWGPLCAFLGCPVPDVPFPNINDRRQLWLMLRTVQAIIWAALLGLPLLAGLLLPHCAGLLDLLLLAGLGAGILWAAGKGAFRAMQRQAARSNIK